MNLYLPREIIEYILILHIQLNPNYKSLQIEKLHKMFPGVLNRIKDKNLWKDISRYQVLSEDFISEFQDKVNWYYISWNQKLSLKFIKEFQEKVDWDEISNNNYLTNDVILEFYNNLDKDVLLERINKKEIKVSQIVRNRLTLDRF